MEGLLKPTDFTAILIATITIFLTNFFTYLFALKKDAKQVYSKYRISILEELYTPIYKILIKEVKPLDGYEGINGNQFAEIEKVISDKYLLVDPILDNIIWGLKEDGYISQRDDRDYPLDKDRRLLMHVEKQ